MLCVADPEIPMIGEDITHKFGIGGWIHEANVTRHNVEVEQEVYSHCC